MRSLARDYKEDINVLCAGWEEETSEPSPARGRRGFEGKRPRKAALANPFVRGGRGGSDEDWGEESERATGLRRSRRQVTRPSRTYADSGDEVSGPEPKRTPTAPFRTDEAGPQANSGTAHARYPPASSSPYIQPQAGPGHFAAPPAWASTAFQALAAVRTAAAAPNCAAVWRGGSSGSGRRQSAGPTASLPLPGAAAGDRAACSTSAQPAGADSNASPACKAARPRLALQVPVCHAAAGGCSRQHASECCVGSQSPLRGGLGPRLRHVRPPYVRTAGGRAA